MLRVIATGLNVLLTEASVDASGSSTGARLSTSETVITTYTEPNESASILYDKLLKMAMAGHQSRYFDIDNGVVPMNNGVTYSTSFVINTGMKCMHIYLSFAILFVLFLHITFKGRT